MTPTAQQPPTSCRAKMWFAAWVVLASSLTNSSPIHADSTLGVIEATPLFSSNASAGVALGSGSEVHAMQVDVLFDPADYDVFGASLGTQPGLTEVSAREIEPGTLRVVVFRAPSTGLTPGLVFSVPLQAKAGVVDPFPIVLTNFLLVGSDAGPVVTRLIPQVRLLRLRDGDDVNGRLGLELAVDARAAGGSVTRVEYYIGGVRLGEGSGTNFALRWNPPSSGPYEIHAIAYDSEGNQAASRTVPIDVGHVGTYVGAVKGTYAGLIRQNALDWATAGYMTMTTSTNGSFSFRILLGGSAVAGSGRFDEDGVAGIPIRRRGKPPLAIQLTHSSDPAVDQVVGKLTDGTFDGPAVSGETFVSEFMVNRLVWNARSNPSTLFAGPYTVLLPAAADATTDGAPPGDGYATATVATGGAIKLAGRLADGEKLTHATFLSKDGTWPLYQPLYRNKGLTIGEVAFRDIPGVSDGDGPVDWLRLPNAASAKYPDGFRTSPTMLLSRYQRPAANSMPLVLRHEAGNTVASVEDGRMAGSMDRFATLDGGGRTTVPLQGGERMTMAVNGKTGTVGGSFVHPETGQKTSFGGVLFQKQNSASGHYATPSFDGRWFLEPNPNRLPGPEDDGILGTPPLPVVAMTYPRAEAVVAAVNDVIEVKGTAKDAEGIVSVWGQVLRDGVLGDPVQAVGTTAWSFPVPVVAGQGGRFTVAVRAVDGGGNESLLMMRSFLGALRKPLTVTVSGSGTVSRGFVGTTERQVGQSITLTATPARNTQFAGWTGSIVSPARTISFLMEEGFNLQANFTP